LLHFLLLGALIFVVYNLVHPEQGNDAHRIEVKAADLDRLRALAVQQWGQEPDAQQMRDLVQGFIREEVLVREALATGMDQGDIIVRRRLAQKMEFLAHEGVKNPSEVQQRAYLARHAEQFLQESGTDLEQLYFNTAQRGSSARADAQRAREQILQNRHPASDVCMLGRHLQHQSAADLKRDFGADFANAVAQLPEGRWSAPLPSAIGLHLVRVVRANERRLPAFETVQSQVLAQMVNAQVAQARDAAYARLLAGYTVVMADVPQASGVQTSSVDLRSAVQQP
jgi:hypothetical protein